MIPDERQDLAVVPIATAVGTSVAGEGNEAVGELKLSRHHDICRDFGRWRLATTTD